MYANNQYETVKERMAHARAEADERRLARAVARGPSVRARAARGLFALAMTLENEATWRAVWDRLGAPR